MFRKPFSLSLRFKKRFQVALVSSLAGLSLLPSATAELVKIAPFPLEYPGGAIVDIHRMTLLENRGFVASVRVDSENFNPVYGFLFSHSGLKDLNVVELGTFTSPDFNGSASVSSIPRFKSGENGRAFLEETFENTFNGFRDDGAIIQFGPDSMSLVMREGDIIQGSDLPVNLITEQWVLDTGNYFWVWPVDGPASLVRDNGEGPPVAIIQNGVSVHSGKQALFRDPNGTGGSALAAMSEEGDFLFFGDVQDAGTSADLGRGFWLYRDDDFLPVAILGQELESGSTLHEIILVDSEQFITPPPMSRSGNVVLSGTLREGESFSPALIAWKHEEGGLREIVKRGDVTPSNNGAFLGFDHGAVQINDRAEVLFQAAITGATVNGTTGLSEGIFLYSDGEIHEVARPGMTFADEAYSFGTAVAEFTKMRNFMLLETGAVLFSSTVLNHSHPIGPDSGRQA
jgi:hypothetical protein